MKRTALVLMLPLLLSSCAQIFDTNLYQALDAPPTLDSSALRKSSVADLKSRMADDSFYDQLKDDPKALAAVQGALDEAMNDPNNSKQETVDAASALVDITARGSGVADLNKSAVENINSISDYVSAGNYAKALKLFMGNQSESETKATLDNLITMSGAVSLMQKTATNADGTVNEEIFYSGTKDRASFSQSALMAAISKAMTTDTGSTAALAAGLAVDEPVIADGADMTAFKAAQDADASKFTVAEGTSAVSGYSYTYVATLKSNLAVKI